MILREEPLCRHCGAAASQVDHIVPLSRGGTDARENLQPLCHSCHSKKTASERLQGPHSSE
ncbi:MAG: HNH endonuclease [Caulobacteraceae bacterium]|nr:HNH endonuclease [Caulobacteraceae bacterium]